MKMLKSFGCSFIYGTDLSDCDSDPNKTWSPSHLTWPALLAQRMGYQYACYAKGGRGNLFILNQILNQITTNNNDLFVIGWTWAERQDYLDSNRKWQTVRATDDTELCKFYYKNLYSDHLHRLQNLVYVNSAVQMLTQHKIPFVMTHMDMGLFDHPADSGLQLRGIDHMADQLRPYMTTFDGLNFVEWSRKNNYAESELWHPLEPAHQAAADYVFNRVFDTQKTSDPIQPVRV